LIELLSRLDEEQILSLLNSISQFVGPIPPPDLLKKYEDALDGAADRIIKMAEKQSAHRQWMEKQE
jgi:uncharacterized membrane protein